MCVRSALFCIASNDNTWLSVQTNLKIMFSCWWNRTRRGIALFYFAPFTSFTSHWVACYCWRGVRKRSSLPFVAPPRKCDDSWPDDVSADQLLLFNPLRQTYWASCSNWTLKGTAHGFQKNNSFSSSCRRTSWTNNAGGLSFRAPRACGVWISDG